MPEAINRTRHTGRLSDGMMPLTSGEDTISTVSEDAAGPRRKFLRLRPRMAPDRRGNPTRHGRSGESDSEMQH